MLNHVMIGVSDIEKSKAFYDAVLGELGAGEPMRHVNDTGQTRLFYNANGDTFCLTEPIDGNAPTVANGSTIGFKCKDGDQVVRIHDIALEHGGSTMEDPPGPREGSMGTMHLSYFTDPDGHKLCGIHREA